MSYSVYEIRNAKNNKRYIGSTGNTEQRKQRHFGDLHRGTHHSAKLQRAYNKYGSDAFIYTTIQSGIKDRQQVLDTEQYYIDHYKAYTSSGYNVSRYATNMVGHEYWLFTCTGTYCKTFLTISEAANYFNLTYKEMAARIYRNKSSYVSLLEYNNQKCMLVSSKQFSNKKSVSAAVKEAYKSTRQNTTVLVYNIYGQEVYRGLTPTHVSKEYNIEIDKLLNRLGQAKIGFIDHGHLIFVYEYQGFSKTSIINYAKNSISYPSKRRVAAYSYETEEFIGIFDSSKLAAEYIGISESYTITEVVRGRRRVAYGYWFCFADTNGFTTQKGIAKIHSSKRKREIAKSNQGRKPKGTIK